MAKRDVARDLARHVRDVLLNDWDPLGLGSACPADEYDTHVWPLVRMLTDGATEDQLADYLHRAEAEEMALHSSAARRRMIAGILLGLR